MILIIDNYDSFTYNLVHLIAEHTDRYEVRRNDQITINEIKDLQPAGILISPGPGRPEDAGITCEMIQTFCNDIPILGVCLGLQAIGAAFGGNVIHAPELMHGKTSAVHHDGNGVFKGIDNDFSATRYHSLVLEPNDIPDDFEVTARSSDGAVMGIRHSQMPLEGIQFHPESYLTENGNHMIANWIQIIEKSKSIS